MECFILHPIILTHDFCTKIDRCTQFFFTNYSTLNINSKINNTSSDVNAMKISYIKSNNNEV